MKEILTLVVILAGLVLLSGCVHEENTGTLILQITDKTSDLNITQALVTISNIEVHLSAGGTSENETNNTSAGWYTVVETPQTFDLIEIKDAKEFLGSANLTAGWYTQIRLHVDKALVTIDGVKYNLTIPSKTVKLIKPFQIKNNQTTTLILDFDAQKSIHETGNNKFIMQPTITITQE